MQPFKKTAKQLELTKLLGSPANNIMAFGGSRSGKTFELVRAIFVRAAKRKSRHVILRLKFNHIKTSIWHETIPKVLAICFPDLGAIPNKTDYFYTLPNGSEVWIGGLDEKIRVEKILGKEYSTIYFNECSSIPRESIDMAKTRLAENSGLVNKFYYDMNPPTKKHWSYWQFIKHWDDRAERELSKHKFVSILMNPRDNIENLPDDYLQILRDMPENMRRRFLDGEFVESDEGEAYYEFDRERHVKECKKENGQVLIGQDFNVDPMASCVGQYDGYRFYIFDELVERNSDTPRQASKLIQKGYAGASVYPDSTGRNRKTSGKSDFVMLQEDGFSIVPTRNPMVRDRINNINRLLKAERIIISPKCKKLINDLEKVSWRGNDLDQKTDPLLTHVSDALGYLCWKIAPIKSNAKRTIEMS